MHPDGIPASLSSVKWDFYGPNSKAIHERKAFSGVIIADVHCFCLPLLLFHRGLLFIRKHILKRLEHTSMLITSLELPFCGEICPFHFGVCMRGFAEDNKQLKEASLSMAG